MAQLRDLLVTGVARFVNGAYFGGASTFGSATRPIWWNNGFPQATTYSLSATLNAGSANRLAYYSGANAVSASAHYASATQVGINITNIDTIGSRALYVNGTSQFSDDIYANKSIRNLAVGGGLYWNPYVESTTDGSDAASITLIKSGVAGGTELRISQQNDSNDVINLYVPNYIYLKSKRAFTVNDEWLRINDNSAFSSGIYTGTSLIRTDNQLQVGDAGANFYVKNTGDAFIQKTLGIGGVNIGYRLYVNGNSYFNGLATINYTKTILESPATARQTSADITIPAERNGAIRMRIDIASSQMTTNNPGSDGYITTFQWDNSSVYHSQLFLPIGYAINNKIPLKIRGQNRDGTWGSWIHVPLTATSSTDNAVVRFDGTSGNIQNSSAILGDNGEFQTAYVGVNGQNLNYKLYVNGTSYFNGNTTHNGQTFFAGLTNNGSSIYQFDGATYRNPEDHKPEVIINSSNSTVGINGYRPGLVLYNPQGNLNATVGLTFAFRETASSGNSVMAAAIMAVKESAGTYNAWSQGGLQFVTKNMGSKIDAMRITNDGKIGINTTAPEAKFHLVGDARIRTAVNQEVIIAGQWMPGSAVTGNQDGNDRPGLRIFGYYPQMVLMSGGAENVNHGATISLGGFDSATATSGTFKMFTIGTPGYNVNFMDVGYGTSVNPHENGMNGYSGYRIMRFNSNGTVQTYNRFDACNRSNSASYMESAIQIRERSFGGAQDDTWATAPRLSWHWAGRVQCQIGLNANGYLYWSSNGFSSAYPLVIADGRTYNIGVEGQSRYLQNAAQWDNYCNPIYGADRLVYFNRHYTLVSGGTDGTLGNVASVPTADWYHVIRMNHGNGSGYYNEIASCFHSNDFFWRRVVAGSGSGWMRMWVQGNAVTSAVWNDYAEYRESDCEEFGYVLAETGNDTLTKTIERLQHFAGISSDTWGFSQGETGKAKTPIAVAGRVLVYPYQDRNNYKPGDCVCAAPGGTVDIMTREEIIKYPDRIVGTVSCVPTYEEWGGGELADRDPVKINGRIWIKVK